MYRILKNTTFFCFSFFICAVYGADNSQPINLDAVARQVASRISNNQNLMDKLAYCIAQGWESNHWTVLYIDANDKPLRCEVTVKKLFEAVQKNNKKNS